MSNGNPSQNKAAEARRLKAVDDGLLSAHRIVVRPAVPLLAPPPVAIDDRAIRRRHVAAAVTGVKLTDRAGRARRRAEARALALDEIGSLRHQAEGQQEALQRQLDEGWSALLANEPRVVLDTLNANFEAAGLAAIAVNVRRAVVSVVVGVRDADVVPDRTPDVTARGNPSLRKRTKTEINFVYWQYICATVLAAIRRTLAAAPGVRAVQVAAVVDGVLDPSHGWGQSCLLAAQVARPALDGVDWDGDPTTILSRVSTDLLVEARGQARRLSPLDLRGAPELAAMVAQSAAGRPPTPCALLPVSAQVGKPPRRRRGAWIATAAALVLVVGLISTLGGEDNSPALSRELSSSGPSTLRGSVPPAGSTTLSRPATTSAAPVDPTLLGIFVVSRIIDGDTIEATDESGGGVVTVRILGIDSPESRDPGTAPQCWADQATAYADEVLAGQRVTLHSDPTQDAVDVYRRVLAYVLLADGRNFSVEAAGAGATRAYTYSAPVLLAPQIEAAQTAATLAELGLWGAPCFGSVTVSAPTTTRPPAPPPASTQAEPPPASTEPEPPSDAGLDPPFDTCGAAVDAGYGPYQVGVDPEYPWYDDRDNDGIVCER